MPNHTCLNCGHPFAYKQIFCSRCGQRRDIKRFTFRQLFFDFIKNFINAEKGVLRLVKGLATRPGQTAAAYVEGKRKTYFSPFTFLALTITLMVFVNAWLRSSADLQVPNQSILNNMPDERLKELYLLTITRINRMQLFFNNYLNMFSVLFAPYFAFGIWLFFRKRNRNTAEIMVAYILFMAFCNLLYIVFTSPFLAVYRNTDAYYYIWAATIFLQSFYFAWGYKVFLGFRSAGGFIKVQLVLGLIGVIWFILFMLGLLFLYVYRGDAAEVLKYL